MSDDNNTELEVRMLSAMRKTLIAVAKDTMTKPGLRHPLAENTQKMITDCLNLVISRQTEIEKEAGTHTKMKPVYTDEQTVQSFSVDDLKKTLN
ncbi:MAG: hypothetical protein PSN35_07550 [Candidatus Thioglobus sp.]|uniref:hypothetical protein n=1 Tax=Candidatus Thioglobus sp. TaxID=2026721 RepID=UPI002607D9BD|nr:hypothetical protein [Candidatus Thioglobus sp.]MDC9727667.1 hypothetical protein [Candidatus Thioglobus sp.]